MPANLLNPVAAPDTWNCQQPDQAFCDESVVSDVSFSNSLCSFFSILGPRLRAKPPCCACLPPLLEALTVANITRFKGHINAGHAAPNKRPLEYGVSASGAVSDDERGGQNIANASSAGGGHKAEYAPVGDVFGRGGAARTVVKRKARMPVWRNRSSASHCPLPWSWKPAVLLLDKPWRPGPKIAREMKVELKHCSKLRTKLLLHHPRPVQRRW